MTLRRARRGGWRWPAVLVASAALVLGSGWQLLEHRGVASDVPVSTHLDGGVAAPSASGSATPGSAAETSPAAGQPTRVWRARPATAPRSTSVVAPVRLVVPSVGLDLPVEPTGVDAHGQMALPEHPTEVGWYRFGVTPADREGSVVIAGHVDSLRYGTGPLVRTAALQRGDRLQVRDADGKRWTYAVTRVQRIPKSDFDPDVVFARSGPAVLRVLTCGGPYLAGHGGYQDNLVVTAEPA